MRRTQCTLSPTTGTSWTRSGWPCSSPSTSSSSNPQTSKESHIVKALAAQRRHRAAPVVLMVLALVVMGGLFTVFAPQPADAEEVIVADAADGERLLLLTCAACHGMDAQGRVEVPSPFGTGSASVHFQ